MKVLQKAIAWVLIGAFCSYSFPAFCQSSTSQAVGKTQASSPPQLLDGRDPNDVITTNLAAAKIRSLGTKELVELSFAYLLVKRPSEALLAGQLALGTTKDVRQRAAIHALIAQDLALTGKYEEAGFEALEGQRLLGEAPTGDKSQTLAKQLAVERVGCFGKAGNELQKRAAEDYLRTLSPSYQPTCMTAVKLAALIIGGIVTSGYFIYSMVEGQPLTHEDKVVLTEMWSTIAVIAATPAP